jgi:predicted SAM-dependent methyltransferase
MVKLNFGCGGNILEGWENHDSDVDISGPLPYPGGQVNFIFAEHCVEHLTPQEALSFLTECKRILKPEGKVRIIVPCIDRVYEKANPEYLAFTEKSGWSNGTISSAMRGLINFHGHKSVWTKDVLRCMFLSAGFYVVSTHSHDSTNTREFENTSGHWKVIGKEFNDIESIACEGVKCA